MISFLKTVLIILLVYLGLKYLLKWLSPYIMRYVTRKASERFERAFGQHPFQQTPYTDADESTIEKKPKTPKSNDTIVGEYVDYEEID